MGSLQLELIEPDGEPSTWQEYLDTHGEGVHHIAFQVEGMSEQVALLESRGMPLVQRGEYTGGRYAYIDAVLQLKVILELLEND
jgi:4-hydroxyphenylpyruvate dioxygenase-like putative hemolysin